jgi:ankyrin repeat protein
MILFSRTFKIFLFLLCLLVPASNQAMEDPGQKEEYHIRIRKTLQFSNDTSVVNMDLILAAALGNLKKAKLALANGASLVLRSTNGYTALHWAAEGGHFEIVKLLIFAYADLNARDEWDWFSGYSKGQTPLHLAAKQGHARVVDLLLNADNVTNSLFETEATTPPRLTAVQRDARAIDLLLNAGYVANSLFSGEATRVIRFATKLTRRINPADIEAKTTHGLTALHWAASFGHVEVVKILLIAKANVEAKTNDGMTPLHNAAANGQLEAITCLLDANATIDAETNHGWTPLEWALQKNNHEVIKFLILHGALVKGSYVNSLRELFIDHPLLLAALTGDLNTLKKIVTEDAPLDELKSILRYATAQGHVAIVKLFCPRFVEILDSSFLKELITTIKKLMQCPTLPQQRLENYFILAHLFLELADKILIQAVKQNNLEKTREALGSGARLPKDQPDTVTLLHTAATNGNQGIVELLLTAGANPNALAQGYTPAHRALLQGHQDVVKLLINKGVNVYHSGNAGSPRSYTRPPLLHIAATKGFLEIVKLLLKRGACINLAFQAVTQLGIAARMGHHEVVKTLIAHGACFNANDPHIGSSLNTLFPDPLIRAAVVGDLAQVLHLLTSTSPLQEVVSFALAQGHADIVKALIPSLAVHASSDHRFETLDRLAKTASEFFNNPDTTIPAQRRAAYKTIANDLQAALTHLHQVENSIPYPLDHKQYNQCAQDTIGVALTNLLINFPENYSYLYTVLTTQGHPPTIINNALRVTHSLLEDRQISDQDRSHYTAVAHVLQPPPRPFDELISNCIFRLNHIIAKTSETSPEYSAYQRLLHYFKNDLKRTNNLNDVIRPALTLIRQRLAVQSLQYADRIFYQELENILRLPVTDSLLRTLPPELLNRILAFTLPKMET